MKTFLLAAMALSFAAPAGAAGQCLSALTEPTLPQTACLRVELPKDVPIHRVTTVTIDPKTVAAMPPLPQVDTVIREVVEVVK